MDTQNKGHKVQKSIKGQKKKEKKRKKYQVFILKDRCKGCKLCVLYCPTDTLEMSQDVNINGNFIPRVINLENCKGCNLCFKMCPDFAVYVEEKV
jgi:2-oxoglutarate ferredoxin oxidoreductase subunit delta